MKKSIIIIIAVLALSVNVFSQEEATKIRKENKVAASRDSITAKDIEKHIYMMSSDIYQYNSICYKDSIDITEFYGKQINSLFWKNKGRFYWNPFEPLPQNVRYLHWIPTYEGYIEFLMQKYSNPSN